MTDEKNSVQSELDECRDTLQHRTDQFTRLLKQAKEMTGNLRRNFEGMVQLLTDVIAQTSPPMGDHAKRCAALARSVAYAAGLNPDRRRLVFYAASLHDLSLLGHEEEWRSGEGLLWNSHPTRSAEMIGTVDNLKRLAAVVAAHHEHFDGAGRDIPLESRIVSAVVAYDRSLTISGNSPDAALASLKDAGKETGGHDPRVVELLQKILEAGHRRRAAGDQLLELDALRPGMVLANDLILKSGLVLYPKETLLDDETLSRITAFKAMFSSEGLVRVYSR